MCRSALEIWRDKLDLFQKEEAITADPSKKFQLQEQIKECKDKIQELSQEKEEWIKISKNLESTPLDIAENIQDLLDLLGDDRELLAKAKKAYRKIYYQFPPVHNLGNLETLEEMIRGLESLCHSPFLLHFLAALNANLMEDGEQFSEISRKLRRWSIEFSVKQKMADNENFLELENHYQEENQRTSYLIVSIQNIQGHSSSQSVYKVRGWFTNNDIIMIPKDCHELELTTKIQAIADEETNEKFFTLEQVKQIVRDWIEKAELDHIRNTAGLTLEFFLSSDLLAENWQGWTYLNDEEILPLEFSYSFRIRFQDRYNKRRKTCQNSFLKKWQKIQADPRIKLQFACSDGNCSYQALTSTLKSDPVSDIVGLKITRPLARNYQTIHKALIDTGTPIAIWLRSSVEGVDCEREIDRLLEGSIKDLPRRVDRERCSLNSPIASHISLLWEDPNRPLPDSDFFKDNL